MLVLAPLIAVLVCADPPPKKDEAVRDAMKDVVAQPIGTEAPKKEEKKGGGLDVSKMPFTSDSVKQVVLSWQPQIQGCYEDHLALKDKGVEGTLKTSFVITGEGLVMGAKVNKKTSSLKDPKLHDCVVAVLSNMEFPKPPDGKSQPIEFPFNLKTQH